MIDLSIIIVNYNVKEFLLNLLDSLQKASKNISYEIIVVDNNSNDKSIEAVNKKYPSIITIKNNSNLGFGVANNQALKIAKGKYLLLINPDTIVKENTLDVMLNFMKDNQEIGVAGCKVLNPNGTIQLACRRSFPKPWVSFTKIIGLSALFPKSKLFAKYNLTYLNENQSYEVDAISGSFMMLSRKAYEKVGGFDSDFFMYGEDLDLCYRIKQNGFKVFYLSDTEIIHYKGESTKRSSIDETKIFYDAMHLFVKKHFSNSFIVEALLQIGIIFRKFFAFANKNKLIISGIIIDFILFSLTIKISESIYSNERWIGFPKIFLPWVYIIPSVLQIIISSLVGAYKKNSISILRSYVSLMVGFILITSITFFLKQYAFSRAVVLITYGISFFTFAVWRLILKGFLFRTKLVEIQSNTVIVGTDEKALMLAQKLKENALNEFKILGLISSELIDIGKNYNNFYVLGSIDNLKKVITENKISKVIFCSDSLKFEKIFSVVSNCQGENVDFLMSGNELEYMVGKSTIKHIDKFPLLKVSYNITELSNRFLKRFFDILLSLLGLFFYPFVFLLKIIKRTNGEVSSFIIKLPYVFTGKLSLVGPREESYYSNLYLGKKGLTGLWFIENVNPNDKEENERLNLFYAKNQNIWLDLEILGKTIAKILFKGR